jgi:perosamine synthetase
MRDFIPQIEPWIDDNELKHLKRIIDSTYVVEHELTKEFESIVKKHTGAKHAIAMTNGTMALYSCLLALGIKSGDEVIVPNMTFIATSNAVLMAGAKPVLCEIDESTLCIDVKEIEKKITDKTKAIIPVHLYGQSCDMPKIVELAKKYNLKVLEDAAQGVGVFLNNQHVGTFGDCGILSYYGNKTITCGEGGVVLTDSDDIAKKCYRLKNHGRDKKGIFKHEHIGYNFCFTEMQAAIGISQMEKLERIISKKESFHNTYRHFLKNVGDIKFFNFEENIKPVHWFTSIRTKYRDELSDFLKENGIQTRMFFYPLNLQPCYKHMNFDKFEISEKIYGEGLSLPSSYNMTSEEL